MVRDCNLEVALAVKESYSFVSDLFASHKERWLEKAFLTDIDFFRADERFFVDLVSELGWHAEEVRLKIHFGRGKDIICCECTGSVW